MSAYQRSCVTWQKVQSANFSGYRLFPYAVTVGSLTLFFVILMIILLAQKKLQPAWVLLGSFILIALFLAGLIETAIQLFGNVSCANHPYIPFFPLPLSPRRYLAQD